MRQEHDLKLLQYAVDIVRSSGATFGDARMMIYRDQALTAKDQWVSCSESTSCGLGIRVLWNGNKGGGWGFATAAQLTRSAVAAAALSAVRIAKASSETGRCAPIRLAPEPAYQAHWVSPHQIDPFTVSVETKAALLAKAMREMRRVKGIELATGNLIFTDADCWYLSTEGSFFAQRKISSGAGMDASGFDDDGRYQTRSFNGSFGGSAAALGYEYINGLDLIANAGVVAEEAVQLCRAPVCPAMRTNVVIGGEQLALHQHETVHGMEADRADGRESDYAGGTFLTRNMLGRFKLGSSKVTFISDPTVTGALGSSPFDDDGVATHPVVLVREGIFENYLTSRETAARLGLPRSSGTMRACGSEYMPLVRMGTTLMLPGDAGSLADLISDVSHGIYLEHTRAWSMHFERKNYFFSVQLAREIKHGKLGRYLREASYWGDTTRFWRSCQAVCGPAETRLVGIQSCSKGKPDQLIGTTHGAQPALFHRIQVGPAIAELGTHCA